jgi:hypothetical protein
MEPHEFRFFLVIVVIVVWWMAATGVFRHWWNSIRGWFQRDSEL